MEEEWSLKNNVKVWDSSSYTHGWVKWVKTEDIETLRRKLIEDIDVIDCTEKSKLKKWEIIEEVLEIIDKRFGVEKE